MKETLFICSAISICVACIIHLLFRMHQNKKRLKRLEYLIQEGSQYFITVCYPLLSRWKPPGLPETFFALVVFDATCCVSKERTKDGKRISSKKVINAEFRGETIFEYIRNKEYSYNEFERLLRHTLDGEYVMDPIYWVCYYSEKIRNLNH